MSRKFIISHDGLKLTLSVLNTSAGYYIGTYHPKDGPYSRESAIYYKTKEQAEDALKNDTWPSRTIPWYEN